MGPLRTVGAIDNKKNATKKQLLGERWCDANNSFDHSYYFAAWRSADVAVQQWLGLLPGWRLAPANYLNLAALAGVGGSRLRVRTRVSTPIARLARAIPVEAAVSAAGQRIQ